MNCQTSTYAIHEIPLECDVYSSSVYPFDALIFLFFHSGGLVGGARNCVPPWLVQVCIQRQWTLISASYRLLPQAKAADLLEDVAAAYKFARKWGQRGERAVIVGGASAGFFCATMVAHHLQPQPLALLSITGIPTFRHSFFNSSTLISSELPAESRVQKCLEGPLCVGTRPEGDLTIFDPAALTESGTKRLTYERPEPAQNILEHDAKNLRKGLYSYLVYKNAFVPLLESIDLGYEWAKTNPQGSKLAQWPATVFIQGDNDRDVNADVTIQVARDLGQGKARLIIAEGQGHLFEATSFLEDTGVGMDAVRRAIKELDEVLSHHHKG